MGLIDRDKLIDKFKYYKGIYKTSAFTYDAIETIIENQLSINVIEQKRGHWIVDYSRHFLPYKCSACGEWNDGRTNFCPDCGAEMEVTK